MVQKRTNPFTPAQPAPASMFVGREMEVQTFRRQLRQTAQGGAGHILVTGQRGIGKSSFANYLASLADEDSWETPFVVFRLSVGERQSSSELLRALTRKLRSEACSRRPLYHLFDVAVSIGQLAVGPFRISRKEGTGPPTGELEQLLSWIRRCGAVQGDGVVLSVFIDELDRLSDLERFAELLKELFESESQHPFQLVLVGMPEAREKMHAGHPSVLRNWEQITLDTLSFKHGLELLDTALAQEGAQAGITSTARFLLVLWSDCYPYLLQHLGYSCFEVDSDGTIGEEDFIDGMLGTEDYPGSIAMLRDQLFDEMTREIVATPIARRVLFRLVELSDKETAYVAEQTIAVPMALPEDDVGHSIETMIDHGLVDRHPLYREQVRISSKMLWVYLKILQNQEQLPDNIRDILRIPHEVALGIPTLEEQPAEYSGPSMSAENATVLVADIVGSTSLAESTDPELLYVLMRRMSELFRSCTLSNGGRVALFQSDGVLAIFSEDEEDHSVRGVRAALCIREGVRESRNDQVPGIERIKVRLGLDRGKILDGGSGVFGSAVNVANRVSAQGDPDQVVMTGSVAERCDGVFTLESLGRVKMKNVAEGLELFQISDN